MSRIFLSLILATSISSQAGFADQCRAWISKFRFSRPVPETKLYTALEFAGPQSLDAVSQTLLEGVEDLSSFRKVTSIGDGALSLGRHLSQNGAEVTEVKARNASQTGIKSETQDLVVSHDLLNPAFAASPGIPEFVKVLDESIRIAKVGGEVRHFGFSDQELPVVNLYLRDAYPSQQIEAYFSSRQWTNADKEVLSPGYLLVIRKRNNIPPRMIKPKMERRSWE